MHAGAMIRGDLVRVLRTQGSSSSVVIVTGRYLRLEQGSILHPPAKTYQGYVRRH